MTAGDSLTMYDASFDTSATRSPHCETSNTSGRSHCVACACSAAAARCTSAERTSEPLVRTRIAQSLMRSAQPALHHRDGLRSRAAGREDEPHATVVLPPVRGPVIVQARQTGIASLL